MHIFIDYLNLKAVEEYFYDKTLYVLFITIAAEFQTSKLQILNLATLPCRRKTFIGVFTVKGGPKYEINASL